MYNEDEKKKLIKNIEEKANYQGAEYLEDWILKYNKEIDWKKKNLMRFLIYRMSAGLTDHTLSRYDCDATLNITEEYKKTYKYLENYEIQNQTLRGEIEPIKCELVDGVHTYRGDTMTSTWTVLKQYVQITMKISKHQESWEGYIFNNVKKIKISNELGKFLELCHTYGNFLPVPLGFNAGRSNYGKWDMWDLTLSKIYEWFCDKENLNNSLNVLFSASTNIEYSVSHCCEWLKQFETWEEFVDNNYLQAYVDKNYKPILFFEGHSFEKPLPTNEREFQDFFKAVNKCIEKRNIQLNQSSEKPDLKEKIGRLGEYIDEKGIYKLNKITRISALVTGVFFLVKYILLGGYSENLGLFKKWEIGKMMDSMTGNIKGMYYTSVMFKIICILFIILFAFIGIKGIRHIKNKIGKIAFGTVTILPIIGFPVLIFSVSKYILVTERGWALTRNYGEVDGVKKWYIAMNIFLIIGIGLGIMTLISLLCMIMINVLRSALKKVIFSAVIVMGIIPIGMSLLENIFTIIGMIINFILVVILILIIIALFSGGPDGKVVDAFDKSGKWLGKWRL